MGCCKSQFEEKQELNYNIQWILKNEDSAVEYLEVLPLPPSESLSSRGSWDFSATNIKDFHLNSEKPTLQS